MKNVVFNRVAIGAAALMLAAAAAAAQDTTRTNASSTRGTTTDSTTRSTTTRSSARRSGMRHSSGTMANDSTSRDSTGRTGATRSRTSSSSRSMRSRTSAYSSQRIPVRKDEGNGSTTTNESGGAVATQPNADSLAAAQRADSVNRANQMRQDSIANAERMRQDSIARVNQMRQDSIAAVERARQDSIARADSIRAAAAARRARMMHNGFYAQIGGGANFPRSDMGDYYNTGWDVTGSLGYHPAISPLGIRFDAAYDKFRGKNNLNYTSGGTTFTGNVNDASAWSFLGEATLRIPGNWPVSPYLVGGGGVTRFSDYGGTSGSQTKGQWNAGGGIGFGWLNTRLFLESRYMHVATPGTAVKFVPLIIGVSF